jgi:hypothetical protein
MFKLISQIENMLTAPLFGESHHQTEARRHNCVLMRGTNTWLLYAEGTDLLGEFNTSFDAMQYLNKIIHG